MIGDSGRAVSPPVKPDRFTELLQALDSYRPARSAFLHVMNVGLSNRDPLAEFSEHVVCALWGGTLAQSRVQADYDLVLPDDRKVQVRYVANATDAWVNEHRVHVIAGVQLYALVIFQGFRVVGVVRFALDQLAEICKLLGKRHPNQDQQLQFTARNWRQLRDSPQLLPDRMLTVWTPAAP